MPCYHSKPAWRKPSGGIDLNWRTDSEPDYWIDCNKCEGCRARARTDWATRIYHEAQMWERNCFITLTYDDQHLPEAIQKSDIQKFIKRLRHQSDRQIRYFAVGEYGENTRRPHYHAIIFNEDFMSSQYYYSINDSMYGNKELENIWGMGQVTVSLYNPRRGSYTAGYTTKKINDIDTFNLMSTRPPIGMSWVRKNHDNLRRLEKVIIEGKELPIPRVYLNWLKGVEEFDKIKENLREAAKPLNDSKLRAKKAHYLAQQNLRKHRI